MPLYTHLPEGSVRLLRVECELFTCTLLESGSTHPYDALSYVWGSEVDQQAICIDSYTLSVGANLHAALLSLRDPFIERILWIDAICINQNDIEEKGRQVQSMAKIYAKASRVVVWLGETADDSDQALEAIRKAAEEQYRDFAIPALPEQHAVNSTIHEASLQAILKLLERPWFQRIWVSYRQSTR